MTSTSSTLINNSVANKVEAALNAINREQFAGHSIPSREAAKQILLALPAKPLKKILHLGAGAGYLTALLATFAEQVIAIEKRPISAAVAIQCFKKNGLANIDYRVTDADKGAPEEGPFDAIIVASPSIRNLPLLEQLSAHGEMISLEKNGDGLVKLTKYKRSDGDRFSREELSLVKALFNLNKPKPSNEQEFSREKLNLPDLSNDQNDTVCEISLERAEALQRAKINAKRKKTLFVDELHKLIQVDDIELYRSLAKQSKLPLGKVEHLLEHIQPGLFNACPRAFLDYNHLIPAYIKGNKLKLVTHDPDASTSDIQHIFPNYKIDKILVTPTDFHRLWSVLDLYRRSSNLSLSPEIPQEEDLLKKDTSEPEPHLISVFEALLLDAVAERASDIHVEQYNERIRIRLRVDGELIDVNYYNLSAKELRGLINVIKLRCNLNIAERRLPQGGRSRLTVGGNVFDLRVQTQPSLHGEHVIIRLLPQNSSTIEIEELGFSRQIANHYRRLLNNPAGLVLVVGPTGSGKSTTLYAGLQLLAKDGHRKVITIEDPIEYSINNIQQVRVRPEIDFNFADAMRSFVRQDPDVILVGEIRDHETALEAIRASQTGHVVLSTLHSNDAVDALQRVYDLGIQPNSLASELLAVIAQRLAKKICPHCKEETQPEPEILSELFPEGVPDNFRCFKGKGCSQCKNTGSHGRVAVVEYMQINDSIRNAISQQPPIGEMRKLALDCGLVSMRDSALDHVIQGNIPLSELPRILPAERMAPEPRGQLDTPL